jgi:hypothetical protein
MAQYMIAFVEGSISDREGMQTPDIKKSARISPKSSDFSHCASESALYAPTSWAKPAAKDFYSVKYTNNKRQTDNKCITIPL